MTDPYFADATGITPPFATTAIITLGQLAGLTAHGPMEQIGSDSPNSARAIT